MIKVMREKNLVCTSINDNYVGPLKAMVQYASVGSKDRNFRFFLVNMKETYSKDFKNIAKKFMNYLGLNLGIVYIDTSLNPIFKHHFNHTFSSRLSLLRNI